MPKGDRCSLLFLAGGFFILLDLVLKQMALLVWTNPIFIFNHILEIIADFPSIMKQNRDIRAIPELVISDILLIPLFQFFPDN